MVLEYDAENQLTNVFVAGNWKTELFYDFAGRLKWRREYTWSGSSWTQLLARRYVYDGMLVIQERTGPGGAALVSYTRGLDLSGSLQGAGGIGGLLARTQHTGTDAGDGYYHSDGNGNVTAILAPDGQSLLAAYLYDPYGRTLESSGTWASANVYRFSSKEYHVASGLCYYGYRFYSPDLQRWINRDPIQEAGGINLYGFVGNEPIGVVDVFGLLWMDKNGVVHYDTPPSERLHGEELSEVLAEEKRLRSLPIYQRFVGELLNATCTRGPGPADTALKQWLDEASASATVITHYHDSEGRSIEVLTGTAPVGGPKVTRLTAGRKKPILLGENMKDRVIPTAKKHGMDYYNPRSKIRENWFKNNMRWIREKIKEGREFYTKGRDPLRKPDPTRTDYYGGELNELKKANCPVKELP